MTRLLNSRTDRPGLLRSSFLACVFVLFAFIHVGEVFAKPNILFIIADDLGYGDVGAFFQNARKTNNVRSEPWHLTPQLDTLATEGTQLRRHYCSAPVCAPSRASFLLGVHQGHANVRDNQFDKALESNHTVATMLKQAGYATAAIGKYGLQGNGASPSAWTAYPTKRGFDYYFGYVRHGDGHEHYPKEGLYNGTKECYDGTNNITPVLDKCYTADLFTARAKKWITDHRATNSAQPFFLYLAYDTPHAVLELPTQAYPNGGGTNGGLRWVGTPGAMINTSSGTIDSFYHPDYASATWDDDKNAGTPEVAWPDVAKRYATSVRRIDDALGDLVLLLKNLNIDTNTLIVFTSDNGPSKESYLPQNYDPDFFNSFGPHDGIKRDTWEGGIRVGALARWPGTVVSNQISTLACSASDWMPTFAAMAGLPLPARSDGTSLLPMLQGIGVQQAPLVYIEYFSDSSTPGYTEFDLTHRNRSRRQMQVLFEGNYKGVRYNTLSAAIDFEIYDMTNDPRETNNLALNPSFAPLQQFFKDRVLQVRRPNTSATRPYDTAFVPASTNTIFTNGVVEFATYEGDWPWVPEFPSMPSISTGMAAGLDLAVRPRDNQFGIAFSGHLTIPADDDYTFYLTSDDGAHFRIHEATVIDDDFNHTGSEVSGTIRLKAGRHPFRLYYKHGTGGRVLQLKYSSPGFPKQIVPLQAFSVAGIADSRPIALDDRATTRKGMAVFVPVLANDTDDGQPSPLVITGVTQPAAGASSIVSNEVRYIPNTNFLGDDTFTYTVSDGINSASAKVTVSVFFADNTVWFPFNQTSGLETFDAAGEIVAILDGSGETEPWVSGKWGRAIEFTGSEFALIQGGYLPPAGKSARTTAAWIKTTSAGAIVAWGPNNTSRKWHMRLEGGSSNTGALRVEIGGGSVRGTKDLRDDQWHHVAGVLPALATPDANNILLYVDGVLEPLTSAISSPINTDSVSATIGVDSQNRYFIGVIDELRIYNRALSAGEITAHFSATNQSAAAWHQRFFGDAAPVWNIDDDGDKGTRLLEYAFGSQPLVPDASRMKVEAWIEDNYLHVRFPRRLSGTHELNYSVQVSSDLLDWSTLSATEIGVEPSDVSGFESAIYRANVTVPNQSPLFMRLKVNWE
jgi:arylsulfatase A-like enzyme